MFAGSLVPRRSRLSQSWTLPWAVTPPLFVKIESSFILGPVHTNLDIFETAYFLTGIRVDWAINRFGEWF